MQFATLGKGLNVNHKDFIFLIFWERPRKQTGFR
jgi:hypothetical protein